MPDKPRLPTRKRPASGVHMFIDTPTIVFVTVCTKDRVPWLANPKCHSLLLDVWKRADAWQVARYVVMPDHIHFFACPGLSDLNLDTWVKFWKSLFTKTRCKVEERWQRNQWDTRMRTAAQYADKWEYVRNNPVRHRLVLTTEEWPFQGELVDLQW
jgi:putative transposase